MKHRLSPVILALALGAFAVESSAQTLAEAARQERARQKELQSKAVITNVPGKKPGTLTLGENRTFVTKDAATETPATSTTSPTEGVAKTEPTATKATGPTDNKGRDEKYWRNVFDQARTELTRAEQQVSLLQLKVNQLNSELMMNAAMFNRENRIGPELAAAKTQLEVAQREAEAGRQKIRNLEEELRRSGGLPGWAR